MHYLDSGQQQESRFRNALVLALAVHAGVVFGVTFSVEPSEYVSPQIEVTLANTPSDLAPTESQHIAANNQLGSGELDDYTRVTSTDNLPTAAAFEQQLPRFQNDERNANYQDALTTAAINQRAVNTDMSEKDKRKIDLDGISPEVDRLNEELASLQAELDRQTQAVSKHPRVRRLSAASARQSADAAYLMDWRRRLEAVGNKFYPEASVRYGIYGDLRLMVVIRSDGSLEDIKVLSSSGYAVLDEAAIKIVRMAAPYAPFPPELKATTDKLEIIRTWQFQQNELSSNQAS